MAKKILVFKCELVVDKKLTFTLSDYRHTAKLEEPMPDHR